MNDTNGGDKKLYFFFVRVPSTVEVALSLDTALEISIVRKFRECRDPNTGRLGEKRERYLCAMPYPHKKLNIKGLATCNKHPALNLHKVSVKPSIIFDHEGSDSLKGELMTGP